MNINNRRIRASEFELTEKVVAIKKISRVVKGGRRFSFSAVVVVGNSEGVVGHGLGKANEVTDAIKKGVEDAKKKLISVPITKGTIPHEMKGKCGGGKIFIMPASSGTGVIASKAMKAILELAGISDVLAKSNGSSNPNNVVRATIDALLKLRDPATVAKQRGISINKVFDG